jgi:transposase-like protein
MREQTVACPKCESTETTCLGGSFVAGMKRYRCGYCNRVFLVPTEQTPKKAKS